MGLLEGLGSREHLVKLEELAFVGDAVFGPGLQNYVQGFLADVAPAVKVHLPAQEFVAGYSGAGAKLNPSSGQMIQHRHILGQAYRMMERQLVNHHTEPHGAGCPRQGGQVHAGGAEEAESEV
jgi:hypothetical protein